MRTLYVAISMLSKIMQKLKKILNLEKFWKNI